VKPKLYNLIEHCITRGIPYGYQRAFKHQDKPTMDEITESISDAIMLELTTFFSFDDDI
jgi:hypothetical protein